jgi:hypothetical protein
MLIDNETDHLFLPQPDRERFQERRKALTLPLSRAGRNVQPGSGLASVLYSPWGPNLHWSLTHDHRLLLDSYGSLVATLTIPSESVALLSLMLDDLDDDRSKRVLIGEFMHLAMELFRRDRDDQQLRASGLIYVDGDDHRA